MFIPFDPPPAADLRPRRFRSPFAPGEPHPWAERAARETRSRIEADADLSRTLEAHPHGGKMFGVLVVARPTTDAADAPQLGYLRGFAGMWGDSWELEGFVPPLFDVGEFERLWEHGGAEVTRHDEVFKAAQSAHRRGEASLAEVRAADLARREYSRGLHEQLHATYTLRAFDGATRSLRELFAPKLPPGGAGDCAAPKLLGYAQRQSLEPLALAEFWLGPPPPGGGRRAGVYYPACRGRCGTLLPFMLQGLPLPLEPAPDVGIKPVPDAAPELVFEDDDILVIDKPAGLLSVPGRGPRRRDSAEYRLQLRAKLADPSWPRLVHRLDLATSGLIVAAKHKAAYVALQQQFSRRSVTKRYEALLDGQLDPALGDGGEIELELRVDLDDRPRQVHDPVHGKRARTKWRRVAVEGSYTRVSMVPHTGRTHQLRVHAAHERGLGLPILGDLLYGSGGERLMLHAAELGFVHPVTGEPVRFESPVPF